MSANKFVLTGAGLEIDYTIGANPSFPALTYKAGSTLKSFKPAQIETDTSGLGRLASVALVMTADAGGERFGVFLPVIDVPQGQTVAFRTVGIYEAFGGPDVQHPTDWRCVALNGTAQNVIVPLVETAA